jgi:cytosine/adenosine deaminase-related metal-dependent hydrolase
MILRAKFLMVDPETLIENGAVRVEGNKITQSGKFPLTSKPSSNGILNLGDAMIIPGLVNPHTHLEGPATYGGTPPSGEKHLLPPQSFTDWAEKVISMRLRMNSEDYKKSTLNGYDILTQNGVTMAGDHTHMAHTWSTHKTAKIRRVVFEEIVDLNPLTAAQSFTGLAKRIKKITDNDLVRIGVAPHAPYSVSAELYKSLFNLAQKKKMPFSTHLSELKDENELMTKGTGKIRAYLKKIGRDNHYWRHPGTTSVQYMAKLGVLKAPAFFVHCNYLSNRDINLIAKAGVNVVFCPNSHNYFGHRNHPFRKLLKKKVTIALGTDGLGSNADLSILSEMKYIQDNYSGMNTSQLFRMGITNGLKTLGADKKLGELKPGFLADLTVFPLRRNITPPERVRQNLIETAPKAILTMVNGRIIYRA